MRTIACIAALLFAAPAYADHFTFDKEHTTIMFCANHLGFSEVIGVFTDFDGGFTFDEAAPEKSSVDVTIRPKGIRTSSSALDRELQSEHFFNSGKFPEVRFVSTGVNITGDHKGDLSGNLTLLGVTKPVTLHVHFNKAGYHPLTQDYVAGFSAETEIDRSDFGMDYLVSMVADKVKLEIQTEGIDADRKKSEQVKHNR